MRLASLVLNGSPVVALQDGAGYRNLTVVAPELGRDVGALLQIRDWRERVDRVAASAPRLEGGVGDCVHQPLVPRPGKVLCLGLNDVDHAKEAGLPVPEFPVVFSRVASSLIGHRAPLLRPVESEQLDFEVELAVVIGRGGRRISEADALDHVAGYSVFNDGSVRDVQVRTHQWMLGKNFHGTGALGPALVTPEELPPGASGLRMTTTVGGEVLQDGNTGAMIFGVAETIALLSRGLLLEPGDVIAMGTPAGIGFARDPQRFLVPGESCRVEIAQIGALENPIVDDPAVSHRAATQPVSQLHTGGAR